MSFLSLLNPRIWLALAIAAAVAGGLWYTYRLGGEAPRAELAARDAAAARQALHELRNKERTDVENARRTAALNRELARLRSRPEFVVGPAPADSGCPAEQVCYLKADFERAYRTLAREVREIAGECSKVEIDLDSARAWANGD